MTDDALQCFFERFVDDESPVPNGFIAFLALLAL